MRLFFSVLLFSILSVAASAQTIKTLGFNTTNGQVVAATTNTLSFTNDSVAFEKITLTESGEDNVSIENDIGSIVLRQTSNALVEFGTGESHIFYNAISFNNTTNAATTRTNLGLGWSALTNTNEANFYAATLTSYSSIQAAIQNDPGTARGDLELGNGITATNTFVSYNGTNYTTNSVTISNGIITGWTQ